LFSLLILARFLVASEGSFAQGVKAIWRHLCGTVANQSPLNTYPCESRSRLFKTDN